MISSGRLRHKINVKILANVKDDTGRSSKVYNKHFSMRCNVQILSGSELIKSGVNLSNEYVSILARSDRRLMHNHFFEWKGNMFSIEAIKPSDDELHMVITGRREI